VAQLIDKERGVWRKELVRRVLPIDAELVFQIPLCTSWPLIDSFGTIQLMVYSLYAWPTTLSIP